MNSTNQQPIEKLQSRYKVLYEEKIRVETELKSALQELSKHKETAQKNWGTDDVVELEKKLQSIKTENEKKRSDYQKHLDSIESQLKNIKNDPITEDDLNEVPF